MTSPPPARRLPDGYAVRLRGDLVRSTEALLVGGSPLRVMRLSAKARSYLDDGRVRVRDSTSADLAARLADGNLADPEPPPTATVAAADLTVVVPVRDRTPELARCLAALAGLDRLVVDDGSVDPRAVEAAAARHGATVLSLDHNVGPAGARNAGLARVRTPYVAFVDSDVEVDTRTLLALTTHFADAAVVLAAPRVRGRSRSPRPSWFERYDAAASSLDLGSSAARVRPGTRVAYLPSACLVGRTDDVREVGGFDERMRVGEDVDLVWRLADRGAIVRYDPGHTAYHDTRTTMRGWLGRKFLYGTSGAELASRHGNRTAPAVLSPLFALAAAALLARHRSAVPLVAVSLAVSTRAVRRRLAAVDEGAMALSADLSVRGLGWTVRQESALLLRHWWPAALLAMTVSRDARRMVVSALLVDAFVAAATPNDLDPLTRFLGRSLDDLAYGLGLWSGVLRQRSLRAMLPRTAASADASGRFSCR